jgi:hypothetical protein
MSEHFIIKNAYSPQAYFICDRNKNYACPRVKKNLPCGDCKGTKHMEFAKTFDDEDKEIIND